MGQGYAGPQAKRGDELQLVQSWICHTEAKLGEPVLVLRTLDGREFRFMMPPGAAAAIGRALVEQARQSTPEGSAH